MKYTYLPWSVNLFKIQFYIDLEGTINLLLKETTSAICCTCEVLTVSI